MWTVSTNPMLSFRGILPILAWRVAGHYGADRYLLPLLGAPRTGRLTRQETATPATDAFNTHPRIAWGASSDEGAPPGRAAPLLVVRVLAGPPSPLSGLRTFGLRLLPPTGTAG